MVGGSMTISDAIGGPEWDQNVPALVSGRSRGGHLYWETLIQSGLGQPQQTSLLAGPAELVDGMDS